MPKKGSPKNTKNKAKHSKLMDRKKKKEREKKNARLERLAAAKAKMKEQSNNS